MNKKEVIFDSKDCQTRDRGAMTPEQFRERIHAMIAAKEREKMELERNERECKLRKLQIEAMQREIEILELEYRK